MLEINLLPPEYRPRRWVLPLTFVLVILILAAGGGGYYVYDKKSSSETEASLLQSQLASAQTQIDSLVNNTEVKDYEAQVKEKEERIGALETMERDYELFIAEQVRWADILGTLRRKAPDGVEFNSISAKGPSQAEIVGTAESQDQVAVFKDALEESTELEPKSFTSTSGTDGLYRLSFLLQFKQGGVS